VIKDDQQTCRTRCIDVTRQDQQYKARTTSIFNGDGNPPSSGQSISAPVRPKDVETTDRGSVISSRTVFTLNRY